MWENLEYLNTLAMEWFIDWGRDRFTGWGRAFGSCRDDEGKKGVSGRLDSNQRSPAPQTGAITKLRYGPMPWNMGFRFFW
jgi:hypothetical protein